MLKPFLKQDRDLNLERSEEKRGDAVFFLVLKKACDTVSPASLLDRLERCGVGEEITCNFCNWETRKQVVTLNKFQSNF